MEREMLPYLPRGSTQLAAAGPLCDKVCSAGFRRTKKRGMPHAFASVIVSPDPYRSQVQKFRRLWFCA
jgi:hypothetical protein